MLAGHDPSRVQFRLVVDMTWAMLVEIYRDYGIKFEEAMTELKKSVLGESSPEHKRAIEKNDAQSMAMLQAWMSGSDFGGPRG